MDWKSHKIDALLEQALQEDRATSDATTHLTIDPGLRATGSTIAREELVVAGLGAIPMRVLPAVAALARVASAPVAIATATAIAAAIMALIGFLPTARNAGSVRRVRYIPANRICSRNRPRAQLSVGSDVEGVRSPRPY